MSLAQVTICRILELKIHIFQVFNAFSYTTYFPDFPGGSDGIKRLSTMQETRVRALDWEDPLEKEMAIHSSTLAWKIPWTEEPGRLQSMGSQRVGHN